MKTTLTIIAALIFFCSARAQDIKHHDVSPDTTVSTWEVFGVHGLDLWWHPAPEVLVKTWDTYEVLSGTADTLPSALNFGDHIGNSSNGIWARHNYACINCTGAVGNWTGVKDKYLAFRYKDPQNQFRYGWVKMDVPANASSFTIKEYAMNMAPSTPMTAGQIFATGIQKTSSEYHLTPIIQNKQLSLAGLTSEVNVTITDMTGKRLEQATLKTGDFISMAIYPAGVYVVHVQTNDVHRGFKIILQ